MLSIVRARIQVVLRHRVTAGVTPGLVDIQLAVAVGVTAVSNVRSLMTCRSRSHRSGWCCPSLVTVDAVADDFAHLRRPCAARHRRLTCRSHIAAFCSTGTRRHCRSPYPVSWSPPSPCCRSSHPHPGRPASPHSCRCSSRSRWYRARCRRRCHPVKRQVADAVDRPRHTGQTDVARVGHVDRVADHFARLHRPCRPAPTRSCRSRSPRSAPPVPRHCRSPYPVSLLSAVAVLSIVPPASMSSCVTA